MLFAAARSRDVLRLHVCVGHGGVVSIVDPDGVQGRSCSFVGNIGCSAVDTTIPVFVLVEKAEYDSGLGVIFRAVLRGRPGLLFSEQFRDLATHGFQVT